MISVSRRRHRKKEKELRMTGGGSVVVCRLKANTHMTQKKSALYDVRTDRVPLLHIANRECTKAGVWDVRLRDTVSLMHSADRGITTCSSSATVASFRGCGALGAFLRRHLSD